MEWMEIKVEVKGFLRDVLANHCFEHGAQAVDDGDLGILKAYFLPQEGTVALTSLKALLSELRQMHPTETIGSVAVATIPQGDWVNEYKKHFHAQKLTERLYLLPQWEAEQPVPPGFAAILMEAGPAFGTGLHPSTRLTLRLMEQALRNHPSRQSLRAFDIGTGTGILAIAAKKLGVPHVEAVEIDPISIEVANENFALNGCPDVQCTDRSLAEFQQPFDLLLANILLETHRELVGQYERLLRSAGVLIVSGLLGGQKRECVELFQQKGLREMMSAYEQEWVAVAFTRDFEMTGKGAVV